ncbi:MAG: hypothetical protein PVF15_06555 [Candidatus Bathyarchaeota archaeon]
MDEEVLNDILATDGKIRYVGILNEDLNEVMSRTRKDVNALIGREEADDRLVKLAAPVILGALSQMANKCGKLICSGARFDGITLMFFKMGEKFVVVSTDPGPPYPIMKKLEEKCQV